MQQVSASSPVARSLAAEASSSSRVNQSVSPFVSRAGRMCAARITQETAVCQVCKAAAAASMTMTSSSLWHQLDCKSASERSANLNTA